MAPKAILGHNKTSTNGPSEKRTTSAQRTAHLPPVDFTIELIHFKPPGNFVLAKVRWELISVRCSELKGVRFSPKTDSGGNADACRPLSLRHRCWILKLSTIVALLCIVLAFLVSVRQRRGRVQPSQITTPKYAECLNGYLRILDPQRRSRTILRILVLLLPPCY